MGINGNNSVKMKTIKQWYNDLKEEGRERAKNALRDEAVRRFNIIEVEGKCYITLDGEVCSTHYALQQDACAELFALREMYYKKHLSEL